MRYLNSFFITLVFYLLVFIFILYSFQKKENLSNKDVENKINLSLNQFVAKPKEEVKEKIIEKLEKHVKKEEIKKVLKKPIEKKVIVEKKINKEKIKEIKKLEQASLDNNKILKKQINEVKNIFLFNLRKKIIENKIYPKSALRRGIEGKCKISFTILKNGTLGDIQFLESKKIFEKSILKTLNDSFPVAIPNEIDEFPLKVSLALEYKLN